MIRDDRCRSGRPVLLDDTKQPQMDGLANATRSHQEHREQSSRRSVGDLEAGGCGSTDMDSRGPRTRHTSLFEREASRHYPCPVQNPCRLIAATSDNERVGWKTEPAEESAGVRSLGRNDPAPSDRKCEGNRGRVQGWTSDRCPKGRGSGPRIRPSCPEPWNELDALRLRARHAACLPLTMRNRLDRPSSLGLDLVRRGSTLPGGGRSPFLSPSP